MKDTKSSTRNTAKVFNEKDLIELQLKKCSDKMSLCLDCKNAVGNCSWSANFVPVKGWKAEPSCYKDNELVVRTYKILQCPLYQPDRPCTYGYEISMRSIAELCGVSSTYIHDTTIEKINKKLEKLNLKVIWYRDPEEDIGNFYVSLIK